MDRDVEKASVHSGGASSGDDSAMTMATQHHHQQFEPLATEAEQSRISATSAPVSRTHSQNGYGVSEGVAEESDEAPRQAVPDAACDEKDPFEIGWDGGDADPLCPRSFLSSKKWLITIIVSGASFCVTGASSIYSSTYEKMEAEFHNARIISTLGLSLFVLGISLGPMLMGPLSEFYGRRPIYVVSWTFYVIWIVPQAVAQNIQTILVSRFLNGFAGSAFLAVSGGTVGDLFARHQLQKPMMMFSLAPFVGPSIGPLIGGFINYNTSWRWTYYVLLIWGFAMWLLIVFLVPETYHPILLRNKARAYRKETGDERYRAPTEKVQKSIVKAISTSLLRPFQLLAFEFMVQSLCLFSAILLGILYLFFGAFPLVFGTVYGFKLWQQGLSFCGILVGLLLTSTLDPIWLRLRMRAMARLQRETGVEGASEPEFRLPPAIVGSLLVPCGIFMFAWSSYPWVHWIVPIIGSSMFGAGTILVFSGIFTFLVDAYPQYAASALAANAFVRCAFAAAFPLFGSQMYHRLGIHWATSLLAFLTVAMVPFPFIFYKYGKRLRATSRYAKSS